MLPALAAAIVHKTAFKPYGETYSPKEHGVEAGNAMKEILKR